MATRRIELRDGDRLALHLASRERLGLHLVGIGEGEASVELRLREGADLRLRCPVGRLRVQARVLIDGPGARATIIGTYQLIGKERAAASVVVEHRSEGSRSLVRFAGIVSDESCADLSLRTVVHPGADGTEAEQRSQAIIEHETAKAIARPELEIYSEDVSCSHGVSVGAIDEAHLRYMASRGIGREEGRALLHKALLDGALACLSAD